MIILLEEHPAQHVGAAEVVLRHQRRTVAKVEAGGIALRDEALADLEHGNAAVRIDADEELGSPRLTLQYVIFPPLDRNPEQSRRQPDLVAVSGLGIFVEDQLHCRKTM